MKRRDIIVVEEYPGLLRLTKRSWNVPWFVVREAIALRQKLGLYRHYSTEELEGRLLSWWTSLDPVSKKALKAFRRDKRMLHRMLGPVMRGGWDETV